MTPEEVERRKADFKAKETAAQQARISWHKAAIELADQDAAARGITIGSKVMLKWNEWRMDGGNVPKSKPAFYMGHHIDFGRVKPIWRAVKKDGTPSEKSPSAIAYSAKMEPIE